MNQVNNQSKKPVECFDKYLLCVGKLQKRYTKPDGYIIYSVGGKPAIYKRLEQAAWVKYVVNG